MAIQVINIGAYPNDSSGDDIREAFRKINSNFNTLNRTYTINVEGVINGVNVNLTDSDGDTSSILVTDSGNVALHATDQHTLNVSGAKYMGATPPSSPINGQEWFNTTDGTTYTWYQDIDSGQWVSDANTGATPIIVYKHVGATPPLNPISGQEWFNTTDGTTYTWYEDIDSGQWVSDPDGGNTTLALYKTVASTPPSSPVLGQEWFNADEGVTYTWYVDDTGGQWIYG
jgi:hypothetical protein